MKYKLPRLSSNRLTPRQAIFTYYPHLRAGLAFIGLAHFTFLCFLSPSAASAQPRPKRSGYGTNRIAAAPEKKERDTAATSLGRGGEGGQPLPSPLTADERDGNQLVELAAKDVFRQRAIEAKVRQRVFAYGQEVVGSGEYFQFGSGQPKLLRLDMKMQIGPQAATLLQVCGRQDYWIRRHVPPAAPRLEHVNLTRLASALSREDDDGKQLATDHWILLGGLSRLIESLHRNFDFAPTQQARIDKESVLVVHGRLKPERFKTLYPSGDKKTDTATEQIPTAVILTLRCADQPLPHFPYRIEFLRQLTPKELKSAAGNAAQSATETVLSILEFDDVQAHVDLDPQLFEFDPGDEEPEDKTQMWLRKLEEK